MARVPVVAAAAGAIAHARAVTRAVSHAARARVLLDGENSGTNRALQVGKVPVRNGMIWIVTCEMKCESE